MNNIEKYSEDEFLIKYNFIIEKATKPLSPVSQPTAYILGGQPGAGKTTIQKILAKGDSNIFIVNADAYRQYHPHFYEIQSIYGDDSPKYTQSFINKVTEKLIDDLSDKKYNLLIEGTLRTAEVPIKTAQKLKHKGYRVELCVMAVKPEISFESTILRYENALLFGEIPRATSKEHHDLVVNRIANNLDTIYNSNIFDCIKMFTRSKGCIYSSDLSNQKPSEIEKNIILGKWSNSEKENLLEIIQSIRELKQSRNADDLSEYIKHSDKLLFMLNNSSTQSELVKKSNLSLEQVALLYKSNIPFKCKKVAEDNFTIVFNRSNSEIVKHILNTTLNKQNKPKR